MPATEIKLPDELIPADVDLTELDGNAFSVMGGVARGLKRAGNPQEIIDGFREQAQAEDYDHLLRVCIAYTADHTAE